jgi:uncharacterized protein (TIRG00374 family)
MTGTEPGLAHLASDSITGLIDAAETAGNRPERRHRWALPLRLGASALMLGILYTRFPDFEWSEVVPEWSTATIFWLLGAALMMAAGIVLSAIRWQQVLRAMDIPSTLRFLVPLYFAGQFVSNVLPTTIGGDVLRVSRLSRSNGDSAASFTSVVLERLTGWLVLPVITFFGLVINPPLRNLGQATVLALVVGIATLLALIAILLVADNARLGGRFAQKEGWRRFVGAVHLGVSKLRTHPWETLGIIVAGLVYQLALCVSALMVAAGLGFGWLGITALLAFYPAVLIIQVLPIGIAGLGVREGAFVLFLTPLGVPAEQAVALGLVLYGLNLIVSLAGAPAFAVGGRARHTAP